MYKINHQEYEMNNNMPSWEEVFNSSDFGDIRRNSRAVRLANEIEGKLTGSASRSLPDRGSLKAASRFLNVKAVTPEKLTEKFIESNFQALGCKHVLIVQDTTELNFSWRKKDIEGLGPITKDGNQGFYLHPGMIVNPDNESVLGLASVTMWSREYEEKSTKNTEYKNRPIEEKESYKWFMVPQAIQKYLQKDITYTIVGDRESDIYEFMHAHQEGNFGNNCQILIRASQNRKIVSENDTLLFSAIKSWEIQGLYKIDIESNHKRTKRKADIEVRFGEIKLALPKGKITRGFKEIQKIYVIDALERDVPEGEEPIHWTLLTTWEVHTFRDAIEKIRWYTCRWFIEELFRILKSGYKVENVKFDSSHALKNWCSLRLMMAVRLLYLLNQRDIDIEDSAVPFFSSDEIMLLEKLEEKIIPAKSTIHRPQKRSFAWAVLIIAVLGGYKSSPSAKPPGQSTLWCGLDKLETALLGFKLSQ